MQGINLKGLIQRIINSFEYHILKRCFIWGIELKWKIYSCIPGWKGVSGMPHKRELIVSMTSYPARIHILHHTIRSVLLQSEKPDKVILWLASEQFPEGELSLPPQLLKLKKFGLTIDWYRDIKSYKKLIPTLRKYPDAVIVTVDDDIYYSKSCLKILYESYLSMPDAIHAHRVTEFYFEDSYKIRAWLSNVSKRTSFCNKLVGCGGVLYPPHCLNKEVLNEQMFMEICSTNDDIWFWLMAVLEGIKIHVPNHNLTEIHYVPHTQEGLTLWKNNDCGPKLLWVQFANMLEHYPELDSLLRQESEETKGK